MNKAFASFAGVLPENLKSTATGGVASANVFESNCGEGPVVECDNCGLHRYTTSLERDGLRYRWLRTAGAWDSEIGMDTLSEDPVRFDAAVDAAMARVKP